MVQLEEGGVMSRHETLLTMRMASRCNLDKKVALFERMQHDSQDDALYEKRVSNLSISGMY